MRRALLALCSLFVLTTAGVCDSDSTSPGGSIVGTYTLATVDSHQLPAEFDQGTLSAGSATVGESTFTLSLTLQGLGAQVITGTWSQSGSTYTFVPSDAEDASDNGQGTLSGSTLTITTTDHVFVFTKN
jgi:hypothetical protein